MTDEHDRWLTVAQVAEHLVVTEETVRKWIRAGELAVLDLGARRTGYRIRQSDLDAFIVARYGPVGKLAA